MQPFRTKRVIFLGEQDGPSERLLKGAVRICLTENYEIQAAYLVRASLIETPGITVALCIYPVPKSPDGLLRCIGDSFKSIFHGTEHLDVLFLDADQKKQIDAVAKPFFERNLTPQHPSLKAV